MITKQQKLAAIRQIIKDRNKPPAYAKIFFQPGGGGERKFFCEIPYGDSFEVVCTDEKEATSLTEYLSAGSMEALTPKQRQHLYTILERAGLI